MRHNPLGPRLISPVLIHLLVLVSVASTCLDAQENLRKESAVDRLLRYVRYDTQSNDDSTTIPTTVRQFVLAHQIAGELRSLGLKDVVVTDHCFVYATLPSNLPEPIARRIPVIGLIAHMDTSPSVSGANVRPVVHHNYQGGDIVLPDDTTQVIRVKENPRLLENRGSDIITADGTTLLGADDKAGIAAITTALQTLRDQGDIGHGAIKIAFTPDEETGTGIGTFDVRGFGAQYAYTIDGGETGEINAETWSADEAILSIRGRNTHPGTAKGIMINSVYAMADFLRRLPATMRPEQTDGRAGFVHPESGSLGVEQSKLKLLLRDFAIEGLQEQRRILESMCDSTRALFPGVTVSLEIKNSYRNMKSELDKAPFIVEYAMEACRRAGVEPKLIAARGGTDGSDLTFMGLPCPNLFTGGENFHGKLEWIPVRGLEKSVQMILHLIQIWKEKSLQ